MAQPFEKGRFVRPVHEGSPATMPDITGARILIIDDQETNVRLLERILRRAGFGTFATTMDSRLAMSLYLQFRPDIVLLDLRMVPVDGFEILKQLQARIPLDGSAPVLVTSADASDAVRRRALSLGASDIVTKPFRLDEVQRRVEKLLEGRAAHVGSLSRGPRPVWPMDHSLEGRPFTYGPAGDVPVLAEQVAHDLTNLMAVISNYAAFVVAGIDQQMASPVPSEWAEIRGDVEEIRVAAERLDALSARLLAGGAVAPPPR